MDVHGQQQIATSAHQTKTIVANDYMSAENALNFDKEKPFAEFGETVEEEGRSVHGNKTNGDSSVFSKGKSIGDSSNGRNRLDNVVGEDTLSCLSNHDSCTYSQSQVSGTNEAVGDDSITKDLSSKLPSTPSSNLSLSPALIQILQEVARSGTCTDLNWTPSYTNVSPVSTSKIGQTHASPSCQSTSSDRLAPLNGQYSCLKYAIREALDLVLESSYERAGYVSTGKESSTTNKYTEDKSAFLKRKERLMSMMQDREAEDVVGEMINVKDVIASSLVMNGRNTGMMNADDDNNTCNASKASSTDHSCSLASSASQHLPQHLKAESTSSNASLQGANMDSNPFNNISMGSSQQRPERDGSSTMEGPPFTIQRLAEVLLSPEYYYTQTHKLCNGLEKLLLVTSSVTAFGGGYDDGMRSPSEREMAALADERGRVQQRKFRRKLSCSNEKNVGGQGKDSINAQQHRAQQIRKHKEYMRHQTARLQLAESLEPSHPSSPPHLSGAGNGSGSPPTSPHSPVSAFNNVRRGSDDRDVSHYGGEDLADTGVIDHESFLGSRDHRVRVALRDRFALGEDSRPRAPSPPASPPSSPSLIGSRRKFGKISSPAGNQQALNPDEERARHLSITRTPSPILYARSAPSMGQNNSSGRSHSHLSTQMLQQEEQLDFELDNHGNPNADNGDLEVEPSKSNSSVSSDSDDDSLSSDRSDGSESGYEPITAARVMALNRMQQQQRREQILQNRALAAAKKHRFHPPPDSEYQSGDSIDSMKAYDSDGSESSSSV